MLKFIAIIVLGLFFFFGIRLFLGALSMVLPVLTVVAIVLGFVFAYKAVQ